MAISANGMIARTNDKTDWSEAESNSYINKVKEYGNMVIGRRTYEIMQKDANKDADIAILGDPLMVVLTSNNTLKDQDKVKFVHTPAEALECLNKEGFETAMIAGGSKAETAFLKENLIDEIYLDVEPLVIGEGFPLFSSVNVEVELTLLEVNKIGDGTVQLHYAVKK